MFMRREVITDRLNVKLNKRRILAAVLFSLLFDCFAPFEISALSGNNLSSSLCLSFVVLMFIFPLLFLLFSLCFPLFPL